MIQSRAAVSALDLGVPQVVGFVDLETDANPGQMTTDYTKRMMNIVKSLSCVGCG